MARIIYLYKKTHNKTGLQYLGKTSAIDPNRYQGSGTYWTDHLDVHGYDVTTEILRECSSNEEVKEWGIYYSRLWNIVDERDVFGKKTWANLKEETGDGGTTSEIQNRPERLEKNKEATKLNWKNPEIRQKRLTKMIESLNNPDVSNSKRISMKKTMNEKMKDDETLSKYRKIIESNRVDNTDARIYEFAHVTGKIETCTRKELISKYNLHKGNVSSMLSGKSNSTKGWRLNSNNKGN